MVFRVAAYHSTHVHLQHCWQSNSRQSTRYSRRVICNSAANDKQGAPRENVLAQLSVAVLTEGLRLAGVGAREYQQVAAAPPASRPLRRGDVGGVLRAIRKDYQREYFITGVLTDAIYDDNCRFADPTVSFSGRELWKRNLQLLVPFLIEPAIKLKSLRRMPQRANRAAAVQLYAEWLLTCYVALPWRPYVYVNGSTTYTLNADGNKVVNHVEAWDVSAVEAVLLLLRPSERAVWKEQ